MPQEFGELIEEDLPAQEFGEFVQEAEPSGFERVRENIRKAVTGIAKSGLVGAAKGLGGTYGDIIEAVGPGGDISRAIRHTPMIPIPTSEEVKNLIERLGIKTEPESVGERFAQRIGEALGSGASLGGGLGVLGALGTGAALGQVAEEAGATPTVSNLVELLGSLGTGAIKGKLLPRGAKTKELVEAGRRLGLTEREISPLVKGKKGFALGKTFVRKADKMEKLTRSIENKLGDSYKFVKEAAKKEGRVPFKEAKKLSDTLSKELKKLTKTHAPSDAKKKAMEILDKTITDLHLRGSSYEKLINTYQDINKQPKAVRNLLEPIKKAFTAELKKGSPELAKDFESANKLYSRFTTRIGKLKPENFDKMINKMEAFGIATGIGAAMMGNPWALKAVIGETVMRSVAKQYLTNPYLQNLPNKFIHALTSDNRKNAIALVNSFKKFMKKHYDEDFEEKELD